MKFFVILSLLAVLLAAIVSAETTVFRDEVALAEDFGSLNVEENNGLHESNLDMADQDKELVRHKRQFGITCRWGGNAACFSRCVLMKRRGGSCRRGTCVCH